VVHYTRGKTLYVKPDYERNVNKRLDAYYQDSYGVSRSMFSVSDGALPNRDYFTQVPCRR